jgi:signal peptidase I
MGEPRDRRQVVAIILAGLVPRGKTVLRGDLVAFHYPLHPDTIFMKRIAGIPGDLVEIRDKHFILNGKAIEEPYARHDDATTFPPNPALPEPYRSRDQFGPVKVPPDAYFMLGDNRDKSSDSRYWGVVPRRNLVGKLVFVISPLGMHRP